MDPTFENREGSGTRYITLRQALGRFATLDRSSHHQYMVGRRCGVGGVFAVLVLLGATSFAGVVEEVREALAQGNLSAADAELRNYHAQRGVDAEYLEALSWLARGALSARQYNQAYGYAKQVESLAAEQLKHRALDAEEHLPIALGAAFEVQAQVLADRGEQAKAAEVLRSALRAYGHSSIGARLQKNLNLLSFVGRAAPPLRLTEHLGPNPAPLAQLKGSPVLLFFWAHWCVDCKAEGPIITRLRSEFSPRGLVVVAPTQRYGYAGGGEEASAQAELGYIKRVWEQYYAGLQSVPVPVSKQNFNIYGASTTPTLVLLDRAGRVALYHPGALPYDALRSAIEKVIAN